MDAFLTWLLNPAHIVWVFQAALLFIGMSAASILESRVNARALARLKGTNKLWDDALMSAVHKPSKLLIWGLGFTFIVQLAPITPEKYPAVMALPAIRLALLIGATVWFVYQLIEALEVNLSRAEPNRKSFDPVTARAIGRALRTMLVVISILVLLNTMGVDMSGLLTFGGVGTLVLGLAAKELLSNFFGGLMIIWDKPFTVGEWIRLPARDLEGVVEEIGWRMTRMRTFDRRPMFVPNAVFSSVAIENPSRMYNRRIKETIGVRYNDATRLSTILEDIRSMLSAHPDLDQRQFMMVHFVHFGPSSLDVSLYCFTKTTAWEAFRSIQEDVFLRIIAIIEQHGGECAFPTQTVHIPERVLYEEPSPVE